MSLDLQTQIEWMLVEHVKRGTDLEELAKRIITEVRSEVIQENVETLSQLFHHRHEGP